MEQKLVSFRNKVQIPKGRSQERELIIVYLGKVTGLLESKEDVVRF